GRPALPDRARTRQRSKVDRASAPRELLGRPGAPRGRCPDSARRGGPLRACRPLEAPPTSGPRKRPIRAAARFDRFSLGIALAPRSYSSKAVLGTDLGDHLPRASGNRQEIEPETGPFSRSLRESVG